MAYPYQSSVQNSDAIRFGSCKVEVGATTSSYTEIGVAKGVTFSEEVTKAIIGQDNAPETHFVRKQRVIVSGSFVEFDPNAWNTMRGSIDVYTSSTGDGGSKKLETGGKHSMSSVAIQLTNSMETTDSTTKKLILNVWKAFFDGPFTLAFQPDEGEDAMEIPFQFTGVPSSTKDIGQQLYRITDEQSTS